MSQAIAMSTPNAPTVSSSADLQRLWFALTKRTWSSLVIVPADPNVTTSASLAKSLSDLGTLHYGSPVKLLSARGIDVSGSSRLIVEMTSTVTAGGKVIVVLDSVLTQPSSVPIALAADAALLCVELGKTDAVMSEKTLETIGAEKFIGAVTVRSPPNTEKSLGAE